MQNVLVTGPSVEPVTLDQAKAHLRLENVVADDTLVSDLIVAARTYFELKTQLALITQTWRLTFDYFATIGDEPWWDGTKEGSISELTIRSKYVELPTTPLLAVTSFKAYAQDDSSVLFTDYYTDKGRRPGRIALRNGSVWPVATRGVSNYEIDYTAGYGPAADNVPADIKIAIKQIVAHWYENREILSSLDVGQRDIPNAAQNIIRSRRVMNL